MWYTPVSGIWQTVWIESVPEEYITDIEIIGDDKAVDVWALGVSEGTLTLHTPEGDKQFKLDGALAEIKLENPLLWTPENPNVYRFTVESGEDKVESYLAFRKIESKIVDGALTVSLTFSTVF